MKRTAVALVAGAAFGIVLGGVGIATAGDGGDDDRRTAAAAAQSQEITEEQARDIAIQAAGGGRVEKVELEVEDGGLQWHIDVIKDGVELDVRIDADTGEVVRFRSDDGDDRVACDDDDGARDDDDDARDDDSVRDDDDDHNDGHDDNSGPGSGDDG